MYLNKRVIQVFIIIILVCSIGLNVNGLKKNNQLKKRYEGLTYVVSEFQEANLISFVTSMNVATAEESNVEIFDIAKGEIAKSMEVNDKIRKEAVSYLDGITGLYRKIRAFPEEGYVIKVPIEPPEKVNNHWLNNFDITSVSEVFIIFEKDEEPFLLVLDNDYRPVFYTFNVETGKLLEYLDFQGN